MRRTQVSIVLFMIVVAGLGVCPRAQAQWAVVDVGAIAQLLQQYETLKQQLTTAENELSQAQAQYRSITGGRGMQNLLNGTNRNYLPSDWSQIVAAINRTGTGLDAGSVGLLTMRERAALAGGSLQIDSSPGHGTRVSASFSIEHGATPPEGAAP